MKVRPLVCLWIALLMEMGTVSSGSASAASQSRANPTFDFSAMDRFWHIVEILEGDREPSPAQWDSLLRTPGYKALTVSEFEPEFFVACFTLAYEPSRADELRESMQEPRKARYLEHYLEVRTRKAALLAHQDRLGREVLMPGAVEQARRFLPDGIPSTHPPVAFVVFADDGRGYEPIVIDLLSSMNWRIDTFLAHESHHWYRNRLLAFRPDQIDTEDEPLVATLNQLQAEGIADQIDKASWFEPGGEVPERWRKYATRYREAHSRSAQVILRLDSLLCVMSDAPVDARRRYGKEIAQLIPMSGHPTGFYMASLIAQEMGIARLVEEAGNPFAFCRSYSEAARRSGDAAPELSAKALRLLKELEATYVSPPEF